MNRSSIKQFTRLGLATLVASGALLASAGAHAADAAGWERHRGNNSSNNAPAPAAAAPAPQQAQPQPQLRPYRGGGNSHTPTFDANGRNVVIGPPRGHQDGNVRIVPPSRAYVARQPRYVPSLPPGHSAYSWRGRPYYYGGGHWYRPYGGSYLVVGPPVGLFVDYLPGSYSSVWVGGTRYYYSDGAYYTWEPYRHGYVVARSPYGDDDAYDDDGEGRDSGDGVRDNDLYIYPMRGQSEQQQSDDRYACHRWAVDQTHYDPTNATGDRKDRTEYDRAVTACLTGRGYSVK